MTDRLKPPPAFATNEWAWSYTLNKCAEKGKTDQFGNPSNYAMANAIYKRVVAKYVHLDEAARPDAPTNVAESRNKPATRAEILRADIGKWIAGHGMAFAADSERTARLYHAGTSFRCELTEDGENEGATADFPLGAPQAAWLTRDSADALAWVNSFDGEGIIGAGDDAAAKLTETAALMDLAAAALAQGNPEAKLVGMAVNERRRALVEPKLDGHRVVARTSKRNYKAMGDTKLRRALRDLEAGHGPEFEKSSDPGNDLGVVRALAAERGL